MFVAATVAILVALVLAVARALAILLLAAVGFLTGRPEWLDIAITYGLLNLISTLAILKFFRHGDLAHDVGDEP